MTNRITDDERVPVRVKDLEYIAVVLEGHKSVTALGMVREYLPKPKLVTVDLDELKAIRSTGGHQGRDYINPERFSDLIERLEKDA